ncbi:uncharacterized protein PV06_04811 [Exophiala oligosperma]|uniref:Major facilitator superfamily (MFS) profile domain-containing protein n=2 Tax=Chaetothyriales TaxID=34395 RepID=A0A0D2E7E1_9EURO|nr:uncharacterized protein PV06_04811 [Exophiala oligosperma]KAJ9621377.1 hypothetical protein H2204_011938 [Knufia peltigerae]KIW43739.1 hypothetical protein PV06_04811 [Exophiala oligosperma]
MKLFQGLQGRSLYLLMKLVCGTSFMMYGYDAGVLGGVLLHKPFIEAIGLENTGQYTIPMISSSYSLAAFVTSVVVGFFSFRLGRRGTIILGNVAAIIGSIIQASSYSIAQLIVGRCCTGFAIGCISSSVPIYLSETGVDSGDRGPANALNAIMLISGVPLAYWIDYGFTKMDNQVSWRVPVIFQIVFAIIGGGSMLFLPDTPRWYYAQNRIPEGDAILARLHDVPSPDDPLVQRTRQEILLAIESELEASASLHWQQFITSGIIDHSPLKIARRLCICFWLPFIREWMGSSLMAYYSSIILSNTGATPTLISALAGVQNIIFALGCVPLYFTIERTGRRSTLLHGAIAMTLLLVIFIALVAVPQTSSIRWASIAILWLFLFIMGYAYEGAVWLYCAEISPLEYRHIGGAATSAGEWLGTFLTVFVGPIGFDNCGWHFWFWVLSGNLVAVVFVFFLCPETGGKTLEQVDGLFTTGGIMAGLSKAPDGEEDWVETSKNEPKAE